MNATPSNGRIAALDVGDARIGVALSDPTRLLASPFTIIHRKDGDPAGRIAQIVQDQQCAVVAVGLPKNMDGSIGPQAKKVQGFVEQLRPKLSPSIEIVMWDERRTTMEARANRIAAGAKKSKRASAVDAEAAAVLLQSYLDFLRRQS